jgi:GNAT superfamily N-acetyltransferase
MMNDAYTIQLEEAPAPEDFQFVFDALTEYNRRYAPDIDYRRLCIFIRDEQNKIIGGLLGETAWGWLHVSILWLSEGLRRQGYGSRLLAMTEAEALARGCHSAHLDTMDFQALPFYQKHGYLVYGQLDDFPIGHSRYFMRKKLTS